MSLTVSIAKRRSNRTGGSQSFLKTHSLRGCHLAYQGRKRGSTQPKSEEATRLRVKGLPLGQTASVLVGSGLLTDCVTYRPNLLRNRMAR